MSKAYNKHLRPRRLRKNKSTRELVQETHLTCNDLVWPVFMLEGDNQKQEVKSMPGIFKFSLDLLLPQVEEAHKKGIKGLALFPVVPDDKKDKTATESKNPDGLMPKAIRKLKKEFPDVILFTDVAMDPYSSDGQDGFVEDGKILNDKTLPILAEMALVQAEAGSDFISPSDMMDHRIGFIREALDSKNYSEVGIMSYAAKYASHFYGPFRDALDSAPKGHKKTYQMNPANRNSALTEVQLDIEEGADIVMVKPALPYLDIIRDIRNNTNTPIAAYNVSGEYSMLSLLGHNNLCDAHGVILESLTAIKRAGADLIFTYFAKDFADKL